MGSIAIYLVQPMGSSSRRMVEWGSLERLGCFLFSAPSVPSQGQCLCSFIPGRISYQPSLWELQLLLVHVIPPCTPCSGLGMREGK